MREFPALGPALVLASAAGAAAVARALDCSALPPSCEAAVLRCDDENLDATTAAEVRRRKCRWPFRAWAASEAARRMRGRWAEASLARRLPPGEGLSLVDADAATEMVLGERLGEREGSV